MWLIACSTRSPDACGFGNRGSHARLVGEMGFLAPDNRRTQTLECVEDSEVLTISYDELRQLYFQNPEFGFYFLRLTSERLFQNMTMMEQEIARLRSGPAERAA
jgi:CRP/FNR family transcriptional regulator, cyclic AMP receptor protein